MPILDSISMQIDRLRRHIAQRCTDVGCTDLVAGNATPSVSPIPEVQPLLAFTVDQIDIVVLVDGWAIWSDRTGHSSMSALPPDAFAQVRAALPDLDDFVAQVDLPYHRVPSGTLGTCVTIKPTHADETIRLVVAPGMVPPQLLDLVIAIMQIAGMRGIVALAADQPDVPSVQVRAAPAPVALPADGCSVVRQSAPRRRPAQPTMYNGQVFRAFGEALWSRTFELLEAGPAYEPEALVLPDSSGTGWSGAIPDFFLAAWDLIVEVKPRQFFTSDERMRAVALVTLTGKPVLYTLGLPANPDRQAGFAPVSSFLAYPTARGQVATCWRVQLAGCAACGRAGLLFDDRSNKGFRCFTTGCPSALAPYARGASGDATAPALLQTFRRVHAGTFQPAML